VDTALLGGNYIMPLNSAVQYIDISILLLSLATQLHQLCQVTVQQYKKIGVSARIKQVSMQV